MIAKNSEKSGGKLEEPKNSVRYRVIVREGERDRGIAREGESDRVVARHSEKEREGPSYR